MSRVVKSANVLNPYNLISQTPKNFSMENYWFSTYQDKLDADWDFRDNVVDVEKEQTRGASDYQWIEVVIQGVRGDKGEKVSDDLKRLVFRNIRDGVPLGTKFRFAYSFNPNAPLKEKNCWLTTNKDTTNATAAAVITRCNGTIASIYEEEGKQPFIHYEEIYADTDLKRTGLKNNDTILVANSDIVILAQFNKYTHKYYINQRFIVGLDRVYKVTAISKYNSLTTYNQADVDFVILYLNQEQSSEKDNFETRLAYNKSQEYVVDPQPEPEPEPTPVGDYKLVIIKPSVIPSSLYEEDGATEFEVYLRDSNGNNVAADVSAGCEFSLNNPEKFFSCTKTGTNTFEIASKGYASAPLTVKFTAQYDGKTYEVEAVFKLEDWR